MISLIVFDLDGTLVDSKADLAHAVNLMLQELGGTPLPAAVVGDMVGEGAAVLVRRALAASGLDPAHAGALDRFLVAYDGCLLDSTRAYPGMEEALEYLCARRPLAVLTNKPAHATTRILDGLGLARFFAAVVGGDTPLGRKPDPAGLEHIGRQAGVAMSSTLLVGDSPIDLETTRRAGARICLARYGFGFRTSPDGLRGDDIVIDHPMDLTRLEV